MNLSTIALLLAISQSPAPFYESATSAVSRNIVQVVITDTAGVSNRGTGVVLANGLVLTSMSLVEYATGGQIIFEGNIATIEEVVGVDPAYGVALLSWIGKSGASGLTAASSLPTAGENVVTFVRTEGNQLAQVNGVVSAITNKLNVGRVITLSNSSDVDSEGIVLNARGDLVGFYSPAARHVLQGAFVVPQAVAGLIDTSEPRRLRKRDASSSNVQPVTNGGPSGTATEDARRPLGQYFNGYGFDVSMSQGGGFLTGVSTRSGPFVLGVSGGLSVMDMTVSDVTTSTTLEKRMLALAANAGLRLKRMGRVHMGISGGLSYLFDAERIAGSLDGTDTALLMIGAAPVISYYPTDNIYISIVPVSLNLISGYGTTSTLDMDISAVRLDVFQSATIGVLFN